MRLLALLLLAAGCAFPYVRFQEDSGAYDHRTDNANIQIYLNVNSVAGLKNADGQTWITPSSDVPGAVSAALDTWNSVTTAAVHFAALQTTSQLDGRQTLQNVFAFDDTPENRQAIGATKPGEGAIAITAVYVASDGSGAIAKTDTIFNPTLVFSTSLEADTFDIQAIATHELGHALGADHSGVLSAVMFQTTGPEDTDEANLSWDDLAFVTDSYPASSSAKSFGTLIGTVTDSAGHALRGALISAQDPTTGLIIGAFSSLTDGTFSLFGPEGQYQIWAEPANGQVKADNLYLSPDQTSRLDTNWQPTFLGSFAQPLVATLTVGTTAQLSALVAPAGASPIRIKFAGSTPAANPQDFNLYSGPIDLASGTSSFLVIDADGLGGDLSDANIQFVGPVTFESGSIVPLGGTQYQMTVDVPVLTAATSASLLISYKGSTATYSGGLILHQTPTFPSNGVVNVFSNAATTVAPGEIVAIYGSAIGPDRGVPTDGFDSNGILTTAIAGTEVTFDGQPAPLYFAGFNGQYYQINVEVPYEVAGKASTNVVVTLNGSPSDAVTLPVASAAPGLFSAAINPDGSLNGATNPVPRSAQYVVLYAVGLGAIPGIATGQQVSGAAAISGTAAVLVNGQSQTPLYAGATPGLTGLDQVNVDITGFPSGQNQVAVSVNGQQSQTIPVWVQ